MNTPHASLRSLTCHLILVLAIIGFSQAMVSTAAYALDDAESPFVTMDEMLDELEDDPTAATDMDNDGYNWHTECSYEGNTECDCDDYDATVHPGTTEICDGVDQDCDGSTDEGLSGCSSSSTTTTTDKLNSSDASQSYCDSFQGTDVTQDLYGVVAYDQSTMTWSSMSWSDDGTKLLFQGTLYQGDWGNYASAICVYDTVAHTYDTLFYENGTHYDYTYAQFVPGRNDRFAFRVRFNYDDYGTSEQQSDPHDGLYVTSITSPASYTVIEVNPDLDLTYPSFSSDGTDFVYVHGARSILHITFDSNGNPQTTSPQRYTINSGGGSFYYPVTTNSGTTYAVHYNDEDGQSSTTNDTTRQVVKITYGSGSDSTCDTAYYTGSECPGQYGSQSTVVADDYVPSPKLIGFSQDQSILVAQNIEDEDGAIARPFFVDLSNSNTIYDPFKSDTSYHRSHAAIMPGKDYLFFRRYPQAYETVYQLIATDFSKVGTSWTPDETLLYDTTASDSSIYYFLSIVPSADGMVSFATPYTEYGLAYFHDIDTDGDSAVDYLDNCPGVVNADQGDANGDGVGDACICETAINTNLPYQHANPTFTTNMTLVTSSKTQGTMSKWDNSWSADVSKMALSVAGSLCLYANNSLSSQYYSDSSGTDYNYFTFLPGSNTVLVYTKDTSTNSVLYTADLASTGSSTSTEGTLKGYTVTVTTESTLLTGTTISSTRISDEDGEPALIQSPLRFSSSGNYLVYIVDKGGASDADLIVRYSVANGAIDSTSRFEATVTNAPVLMDAAVATDGTIYVVADSTTDQLYKVTSSGISAMPNTSSWTTTHIVGLSKTGNRLVLSGQVSSASDNRLAVYYLTDTTEPDGSTHSANSFRELPTDAYSRTGIALMGGYDYLLYTLCQLQSGTSTCNENTSKLMAMDLITFTEREIWAMTGYTLGNDGYVEMGQPYASMTLKHSVTTATGGTQLQTDIATINLSPVDYDVDLVSGTLDGISDYRDNCINVYNPDQTDTNGDGLGDACSTSSGLLDDDVDDDDVLDSIDNCPGITNPADATSGKQADMDDDGKGDACDDSEADKGNVVDGIYDNVDKCPFDYNPDQVDTDADGIGDVCDDSDGDGIIDDQDNCRLDANAYNEGSGDSFPENQDNFYPFCKDDKNDGVINSLDKVYIDTDTGTSATMVATSDSCPFAVVTCTDTNGDGRIDSHDSSVNGSTCWTGIAASVGSAYVAPLITDTTKPGDACDTDRDDIASSDAMKAAKESGILSTALDNCPFAYNPAQTDTDGDTVGDACDSECVKSDGTACTPAEPVDDLPPCDADGDGYYDNYYANSTCASYLTDSSKQNLVDNCAPTSGQSLVDTDGDTHFDTWNPDQGDSDGDGQGDVCDPDADNDSVPDTSDNCASVANTEQTDTDKDGSGDACDTDKDNDGQDDDTDEDGTPDYNDSDDDGDGILDVNDNCEFVANPDQEDTHDRDGIGDACDDDNDNDLVKDNVDNCALLANSDQLDSDSDQIGDSCDSCPTEDGNTGPSEGGNDSDNNGCIDEDEVEAQPASSTGGGSKNALGCSLGDVM